MGKVLALEVRRGYDNRAVMGGMDRFREAWRADMAACVGGAADVGFLLGEDYAGMTPERRADWVGEWLRIIGGVSGEGASGGGVSSGVAGSPSELQGGRVASSSESQARRGASPSASQGGRVASPSESQARRGASPSASQDDRGAAASVAQGAVAGAGDGGGRGLPLPRPVYGAPAGGSGVDDPVARLRGVDAKMAERLGRLDVATVRDLLHLFPRRHDDFSAVVKVSEVRPGRDCTVVADVWESRVVAQGAKGRRKDTEAVLGDDTGTIRAVWFGQQYVARTVKPGSRVVVSGKAEVFRGQPQFNSPAAYLAGSEQAGVHTGRMVPVYPLTEGLRMPALRGLVWQALQGWLGGVEETLPEEVRGGRMPLREAIFQAHYPDSAELWQAARARLAFDELLTLQLAMLSRRRAAQQAEERGVSVAPAADVAGRFLASLPFALTGAQERCIGEIAGDLARAAPPMNRLLQGEVGSGKTVVALAALLSTAAAGFQGALMAPTEVLAEQHFRSTARLLEGRPRLLDGDNLISLSLEGMERPLSIGLLTGSVRAREKRMITGMAGDGTLDLVFGTQALIQDGVSLPNLALAIADEQHRFGVMQRSALRRRGGENPHTLIMSATPIPRTLSLTLYGDLDVSTIDELPAGRQRVETRWVDAGRRGAAYGFVRRQVEAGRQAFVVCPLIEESGSIEARAATEEYERLSGEVFPDLRVGLLHGRMSARDKDGILRKFGDGGLDVLVTTAVVEVGIDVPNATIMLIEGAERFGLAQLHQFRGRVGRGEHKSYCLLLSSDTGDIGVAAKERLSALEDTHDGFRLAEIDLELRGPGDFFGTRQSGLPALRMAQFSDRGLLESARELAGRITREDPELAGERWGPLAAAVARFAARGDGGDGG